MDTPKLHIDPPLEVDKEYNVNVLHFACHNLQRIFSTQHSVFDLMFMSRWKELWVSGSKYPTKNWEQEPEPFKLI